MNDSKGSATSALRLLFRPIARIMLRAEVRRLRTLLQDANPEIFRRMNYATRVLSGWYQDEEFLGADGKPVALPPSGERQSFESLCKKYSGDVAATTMLKELKHVEAVAEATDGTLTVKMALLHANNDRPGTHAEFWQRNGRHGLYRGL